MSWLDTFKNDERSLYWLAKYILENNLISVKKSPTNIEEAREIIQCWENEFINGAEGRIQFEQSKLMKGYFSNILPTESFDWLSVKDPKQLCWVLFYLKFNPPKRYYYAPPNKYFRDFASNVKEIYPLIIKIFDATFCDEGVKQDYLLTMKESYSQFVTGKSRLSWLDIKDEETCSWVWRYLTEKIDKAAGEKRAFRFIKPIDNETIYWSVIALISNWNFLKGLYFEKLVTPLTSLTLTNKCFSEKEISNHSPHLITAPINNSLLYLEIKNSSEITNKTSFFDLYSHYFELKSKEKTTVKEALLDSFHYTHYKADPYPDSAIKQYVEKNYNGIRFTMEARQDVPSPSSEILPTTIVSLKKDKLPTVNELTSSLYNAQKQKILRQKHNSHFGLTKANQKKLTNYAKEHNSTEKKALNKIVKTMLD
ncbi:MULTISPECIES: hypothetical protein [Pseudoalteromonas]|uniref:hypothetical protein n=1 Tax=Pseudoalteromonas TaxID=53246 RepID=UPI001581E14E|nr:MULTISPECIES: hypothetical protein [Pseudoalteromonas]MDI4652765.1 hypothetical protein [Pseudoalteromonas shioyasakiensis]NUJ38858.1 hypothetical protein [Pseudoalteromonas sp. 0303]